MLAGVGCKDYDDDIDDLKGQINDLKGQVELKADASALKAVTDKLNGIDFSSFVTNSGLQTELDKRLADYAKKSDLKDWLTSDEVLKLIKAQGYQTKADVQKLIEEATKNQLTADDVKKIFETMIASDETMGKLQAEMQKIIQQALVDGKYVTEQQMKDFVEGKGYITGADQLSATQINQILTAVANSVSSETATVTDAIKKVLGDNFASYMAEYMNDETVKAEMGKTITDTILNRVTLNWKRGKRTHVFIDEFHVMFENEQSGIFFNSAWRQFRKRGAYPTAITQNVEYLLDSVQASTMLSNSEFIVMLNQAASDRAKLAKLLNISNEQMSYVTNADAGCGLIRYGSALVPFINRFPRDTKLYALMTTKPGEGVFGGEEVPA